MSYTLARSDAGAPHIRHLVARWIFFLPLVSIVSLYNIDEFRIWDFDNVTFSAILHLSRISGGNQITQGINTG